MGSKEFTIEYNFDEFQVPIASSFLSTSTYFKMNKIKVNCTITTIILLCCNTCYTFLFYFLHGNHFPPAFTVYNYSRGGEEKRQTRRKRRKTETNYLFIGKLNRTETKNRIERKS